MTLAQGVTLAKVAIAATAAVVLAHDAWSRKRQGSPPPSRPTPPLLALLGLLSLAAWWNFGQFHFNTYVHHHEFYHYLLGAKYQAELGYTRLYRCVAVAQSEMGQSTEVNGRWVRDLETNELRPGTEVLADPTACTSHFAPDRWERFKADVGYFRRRMSDRKWNEVQMDHGYNATPVWTMAATLLTNLAPASRGSLLALALIDPVLLLVMWLVVARTFGWPTAAVALVWWGTNFPGRFYWTGGALLRADWLLFTVLAVCLARRGRMTASGFSLGYAALLRIFPGFLAAGLAASEAWSMWTRRSLQPSREFLQFAGGLALAGALLVPAASLVNSGRLVDLDAWRAFAANSRKHLASTSTNRMGLKVAVSFDPGTTVERVKDLWIDSPWDAWYSARARTFDARRPLFYAILCAYLLALLLAARRQPPWIALVLGTGVLVFGFELTCYYYVFITLFGLLWPTHRWAGASLCALAAATNIPTALSDATDLVFLANSVLCLLFVACLTAAIARSGRRPSDAIPTRQADLTPS
jgi:hypothetical protein